MPLTKKYVPKAGDYVRTHYNDLEYTFFMDGIIIKNKGKGVLTIKIINIPNYLKNQYTGIADLRISKRTGDFVIPKEIYNTLIGQQLYNISISNHKYDN